MKRTASIILLLVLTFSLISGCSSAKDKKTSVEFISMDTNCKFVAYNDDASKYEAKLKEEVEKVNKFFGNKEGNVYMYSEGKTLTLSPEHYQVIKTGVGLNVLTDGAFELFIAPLTNLWNVNNSKSPPSDTEIASLMGNIGTESVVFDDEKHTVFFSGRSGIDVGAIAKGYAATKAADTLKKAGCETGLLDFGGNICCWGSKKSGEQFRIEIASPLKTEGYSETVGYLNCENVSVVTSGTYERYFEANGKRYHHIIDPKTGYPADTDVLSATIVAEDGLYADAYATAAVVLGYNNCASYINEAISKNLIKGAVIISNGFKVKTYGKIDFSITSGDFILDGHEN